MEYFQLMEVAKLLLRGTTHISEDLAEKTIEQNKEVMNIALELAIAVAVAVVVVIAHFHL